MDITAKKMPPDKDGVRIAELDEISYRRKLWDHRPLTDFWRVGPGYGKKLEANGMFTMGDVALCSTQNSKLLHDLFGVREAIHAMKNYTTYRTRNRWNIRISGCR